MKSILQNLINQNKEEEQQEVAAIQKEINNPKTSDKRRNFLKKTALGSIALTGMTGMSFEDTMAQTTSIVY